MDQVVFRGPVDRCSADDGNPADLCPDPVAERHAYRCRNGHVIELSYCAEDAARREGQQMRCTPYQDFGWGICTEVTVLLEAIKLKGVTA